MTANPVPGGPDLYKIGDFGLSTKLKRYSRVTLPAGGVLARAAAETSPPLSSAAATAVSLSSSRSPSAGANSPLQHRSQQQQHAGPTPGHRSSSSVSAVSSLPTKPFLRTAGAAGGNPTESLRFQGASPSAIGGTPCYQAPECFADPESIQAYREALEELEEQEGQEGQDGKYGQGLQDGAESSWEELLNRVSYPSDTWALACSLFEAGTGSDVPTDEP